MRQKFYHYLVSYVYQKESVFLFENTELKTLEKISSYDHILKFKSALASTLQCNPENITIINYILIKNKKY